MAEGVCSAEGIVRAILGHGTKNYLSSGWTSYISFGIEEDPGVNKSPNTVLPFFLASEAGLESIQMKYNWVSVTHIYVR